MLYAVYYCDARERRHVVAVSAASPEEALNKVIAFQAPDGESGTGYYYNGFDRTPDLDDVVEIEPTTSNEGVQILWHQDYD